MLFERFPVVVKLVWPLIREVRLAFSANLERSELDVSLA
jgi:hypothetical protein